MSHIVTWLPSATILSCEGGSYSKRMRPGRLTESVPCTTVPPGFDWTKRACIVRMLLK